jgi:exodeoxyribonuclease V alpha subunit
LVADGAAKPGGRPLRLANGLLYLERYWQQEELVRVQLQSRFAAPAPEIDLSRLSTALRRLFDHEGLDADEADRQQLAAAVSALGRVSVLARVVRAPAARRLRAGLLVPLRDPAWTRAAHCAGCANG